MGFNSLSDRGKGEALRTKIFTILKEYGKPMKRSEIKEVLADNDDEIAQFMEEKCKSVKTGKEYYPFLFKFNFALKDLIIAGLVKEKDGCELTEKGIALNIDDFNVKRDVYQISDKYWKERHEEYLKNKKQEDDGDETDIEQKDPQDAYNEELKQKILLAISKMSPAKFEIFSRALLKEMGVEFTEEGTNISNDGGIDGFGYHRDPNDFRTTRVVIQCKRFNVNNVSSEDIDKFLDAMNKFQADYGIFVTNSRFSTAARKASRAGTPITLIDGDELARLVIKYQLYLAPIQAYELMDFYKSEEEISSEK